MTRLLVDWTRCDGHGLCARLLPESVGLDEWGFPIIGPLDPAASAAVRQAIASCPRLALRLDS